MGATQIISATLGIAGILATVAAVNLYLGKSNYPFNKLAPGLKQELIEKNPDSSFTLRNPRNISFPDSSWSRYKKTEYNVLMDGSVIGTLTKVVSPSSENLVYEGRIPGYVNEAAQLAHNFNGTDMPLDHVILQHINFSRMDKHKEIDFL